MPKKLLLVLVASLLLLIVVATMKKKTVPVEITDYTVPPGMTGGAASSQAPVLDPEFADLLKESGISEAEILAESSGEGEFPEEYEGLMREEEGIYSDQFDESYLTDGQKKVIFFHAAWCPSCRGHDELLATSYPAVGLVPTYKVDFDTETSLRERFGVTQQHTFVKVNGRGNVVDTKSFPSDEGLMEFLKS